MALDNYPSCFRTHTCGILQKTDVDQHVKLAGWVHRKRDHGQLIFIDLRDQYGITQCVFEPESQGFPIAEKLTNESVIQVEGVVALRSEETINNNLPTGQVEIIVKTVEVLSVAAPLPFPINQDTDTPEDMRLTSRFLDLRREKMHQNIALRCAIIASFRKHMLERGFMEIQTPILTASSPEGARDFLVPSRLHPGKFYALPQAPQQFKQLLMVGGFDRYFQVAPCFRDEDARADRSPGEFYQLDMEMAFASQKDVFEVMEPVLHAIFKEFASTAAITDLPFPQIPFEEAMLKYGTDKPDLRNPLVICDVSEIFAHSNFTAFANIVQKGGCVRAIVVPGAADKPRSFFDKLGAWAQEIGMPGLGYIVREGDLAKGPIAKFLNNDQLNALYAQTHMEDKSVIFFVADNDTDKAAQNAGFVRTQLAEVCQLIEENAFRFCWITDFPMYERDSKTKQIQFSHNPFSMPQGGKNALDTQDPLTIKAYQYDIVCNGVELSSGAIRNHEPETLYKAFEIAGYSREDVDEKFAGLIHAFHYGAPPHGGCAPGIDRMVMLLANEQNIREIIAFPFNQQAKDLMMKAPAEVTKQQLQELHLRVDVPKI